MKENFIMKLGGLIIILGVLFFLSLTFEKISNELKILVGYIISSLIILFGNFWLSKSKDAGSVLISIGAGIGVFTSFGATFIYNVFSAGIGTLISIFISILVSVISYIRNIKSLSILSFILSAISPVIFNFLTESLLILVYLLILSFISVFIYNQKSYLELPIISFIVFALYSTYFALILNKPDFYLLLVNFGEIALVTIFTISRLSKNKILEQIDLYLMGVSALFNIFATYFFAPKDLITFILAILGCIFASLAFIIKNFVDTKNDSGVLVYSIVSVIYFFIVTSRLLEGPSLVIAFIIEGALITFGVSFITNNFDKTILASSTTILGIIFSFYYLVFKDSVAIYTSVIILQSISALPIGTYLYLKYQRDNNLNISLFYPIISMFLLLAYLIKISHDFYGQNFFIISSLLLYIAFFVYAKYLIKENIIKIISYLGVLFNYFVVFSLLILEDPDKIPYNLYSTILLVLISLVILTYICIRDFSNKKFYISYIGVGILLAYLVWDILHRLLSDDLATFIALILYALFGYFVLFLSNIQNVSNSYMYKKVGQIILLLVGLRVIFIDAWQYDTYIAVMICMVVGVIMIGTIFISNNRINISK